ncbi:hypothetical protein PC117_g28608 [Phytophthora cactorum]|uniref:Uncharacterized protein n=1 Tax=Phytophthora cactorum TaxID=29920 RepID=A0A8T1A4J9_9STRA|nr:hypothetical protein PC117_g28608 [Phytophthora cactorum]
MSTSMSRPLDFHRGFPMKMSTTWTSTRSISTMTDLARRSTSRRGSARVAQVTKMKLPEDRTLCAIGLDWKKQVRRTAPLHTEQTQTKKKSLEIKMKNRLPLLMEGMDLGHRSLDEAEGGTSQTVGPERRHLRGRMKIRK